MQTLLQIPKTKNIINNASKSEIHSRNEDEMLLINYYYLYFPRIKATLNENAY